jgi:UDP-N-acetylmuramoyl-L-alanyl-D-glutamate--2,6-diaminopimelate ligase
MSLKSTIRNIAPRKAFGAYHFVWAWLGAKAARHPSEKLFVIGVTGTKGKTTTLELLNAILEAAGKKTALLSSLRMKIGDTTMKNRTGNSMPGRAYIQSFLNAARAARCGYALVEVTSQGVVAHRHRFTNWNMGVMTNLSPEHIESHGSFENYRAAKLSFLKYVLKKGGKVFLNADDQHFDFFSDALIEAREKVVTVTVKDRWLQDRLAKSSPQRSPVQSLNSHGEEDGSAATQAHSQARSQFFLSQFNEQNVALAAGVARELGIADAVIEEAVRNFAGVPGRMEFVFGGPYFGIVDYAHTPDSLLAAYSAARSLLANDDAKLICVLGGAGGGRDTWKRPEMGKIAAHYCDEIILTDEDPYDEDPNAIIDQVAAGIADTPYPKPTPVRIVDRHEALQHAVGMMREGDIVIATGKGSEDWIHRARGRKDPWNEKEIMQAILGKKSQEE